MESVKWILQSKNGTVKCVQSEIYFSLSKEEAFAAIDEKLKTIRETLKKDQQMDMDQFYLIFTRSNELIHVVDCRSQEEYDSCHISHAKTLVELPGVI